MTQPQYDEPEEANDVIRINPGEILDHLLLVWTIEYVDHSPTRFTQPGDKSDVIVVDFVDLDLFDDSNNEGYLARRQWWRQGRLIQTLRPKVGSPNPMLVKMSKGTGSQGYAAPYILVSMTGDLASTVRAGRWFQTNPDFKPSLPRDLWQQSREQAQPQQQQPAQQSRPLATGQKATSDLMTRLRAQAAAKQGTLPPPPNQPDQPGF